MIPPDLPALNGLSKGGSGEVGFGNYPIVGKGNETMMRHPDNLGAAQWADAHDIGERYRYNPETDFFIGRNPYAFDQAIGLDDDRHVFLCAGTRAGKGRSIIINNLLNWRGSIVSVDPKGENASICAARRSGGDTFTDGLDQETYVLDPFGRAQVPDGLRASCNLMDILDAESGSLLTDAEGLAEAMRQPQDGGESESWSKDGAQITALIIAHVKTSPFIEEKDRNLVKVREYLVSGDTVGVELRKEYNAEETKVAQAEGRKPKLVEIPTPFEALVKAMIDNPARGGTISRRAVGLYDLMMSNIRQYGSLIQNARQETSFIDDAAMETQLMGSSEGGRSFNIADLKNNPNGISVFICLPDKPSHPAIRWQKAILTLILDYMQEDQNEPATGTQVLMVLDEFAAMGKMPMIQDGMRSIAGAGVKLFIIVTGISAMQRLYGEHGWGDLLDGCGLQMWFQVDSNATAAYIEKSFGDAQVTLGARSMNFSHQVGTSTSESTAKSKGRSETDTEGTSENQSFTRSFGRSRTHNQSISVSDAETWNQGKTTSRSNTKNTSEGWSISDTFGTSRNRGSSHNNSFGVGRNGLWDPFVRSTNSSSGSSTNSGTGSNRSRQSGQSGTSGRSSSISYSKTFSKGGSRSRSEQSGTSEGVNESEGTTTGTTLSKSYAFGRSKTTTRTQGTGTSENQGMTLGMQEGFHKRPLITAPEINRYLSRIQDREHPAFPGLILVRISGEDPVLIRKCHYDQDPLFEGKFTPHYRYQANFLPYSKQRLIGPQITPEHFVPVRIPDELFGLEDELGLKFKLLLLSDDEFEKGEAIFTMEAPTAAANTEWIAQATAPLPRMRQKFGDEPLSIPEMEVEERVGPFVVAENSITAPERGKVVDFALREAFEEDGDIVLLRMERPFNADDRLAFERTIFQGVYDFIRDLEEARIKLDQIVASANEHFHDEWLAYHEKLSAEERERLEKAEKARRAKVEKERREREQREAKRREEEEKRVAELKSARETMFRTMLYKSMFSIIGITSLATFLGWMFSSAVQFMAIRVRLYAHDFRMDIRKIDAMKRYSFDELPPFRSFLYHVSLQIDDLGVFVSINPVLSAGLGGFLISSIASILYAFILYRRTYRD